MAVTRVADTVKFQRIFAPPLCGGMEIFMPIFRLPDASAYLVAFSGGADSRILLELTVRALLERHGDAGLRCVAAIHLHHGIRGAEADRDEAFCRAVCDGLGIELISRRVDVPAMARDTGESLETAARRARYDFFDEVLAARRIPVLLTAHHADDNLETVLERLLRGSGTRGMGGIPPARPLGKEENSPVVHRPLLEWTRRDVLDACAALGLDYVTDSSNLEANHTRNRIRRTVVPVLEAMAGEGIPQQAALRLSHTAREDEDCLLGLAAAQVKVCLSPTGDGLLLEDISRHHPAVSKRMMTMLYEKVTAEVNLCDGSGTLSATHLEALLTLVRKGIPESSVTLPRGMEARLRGHWLYIRPPAAFADGGAPPTLIREGCTPWGDGVTVTVEDSPTLLSPLEGPTVFASAIFPASLPLPLLARRREAGDTILSHGMTKKLKKLLCDKSIPLHLRDRIPLLCIPDGSPNGEPLWYPGAAFRDGYPSPGEGPCRRITVYVESADPPFSSILP